MKRLIEWLKDRLEEAGVDKMQHFVVAAILAAVLKWAMLAFGLRYGVAAVAALDITAILAALKEAWDKRSGEGTPELKDWLWSLLGAAAGAA